MDTLLQDLRYGLRSLYRSPGFTVAAVLMLALGIGANAAIFSLVNAVLLRPLPAADPDALYRLDVIRPEGSGPTTASYPDYADFRDRNNVLSGLAATSLVPASLGRGALAGQVLGEIVSGDYFSVLGIRASSGRIFLAEEDHPGGEPVVVIGDGLWRRQFGSDPRTVGRALELNGTTFTVVGIAPPAFSGTFAGVFSDFWVPLRQASSWLGPTWISDRKSAGLRLIGRLDPGTDPRQAQAALAGLAGGLAQTYPDTNRGATVRLSPATLLHGSLRGGAAAFLSIVLAVVGVVLLTACANLAGLLLVRSAARRREMAIRLALGAGRARLARQVLTESLLLSLLGGTAGVLLALLATDALTLFNPLPPSIPLRFDLALDGRVLGFALALTLLTGLLVGLAPALQALRSHPAPALKDESAGLAGGPRRSRLRAAFVVAQVAMSVILLIGAGLFLKSLRHARAIDPGFEPESALAMDIDLQPLAYSREAGERYYERAIGRVLALPGVRSASVADLAPLDLATQRTGVLIEGQEPPPGRTDLPVSYNRIGPAYFDTLRIPILGGRDFTERDEAGRPGVVIINETMARRFWPGENPVGRHFRLQGDASRGVLAAQVEIVGVAGNAKYRTLGEEEESHIYLPYRQHHDAARTLLVRTSVDPGSFLAAIQRELRSVDPGVQGFFARTLVQHAGLSLLPARMAAGLSGLFGALALILAVVGVYGVVSYSVAQRTREMGVRMALGARPADLLRLVIGQGFLLIGVGVAIGLAAALALTRLLTAQLYGVSATDPLTFAAVALLLSAVALVATGIPARRAARIDPMAALRHE